jgi:hypothetical protein
MIETLFHFTKWYVQQEVSPMGLNSVEFEEAISFSSQIKYNEQHQSFVSI